MKTSTAKSARRPIAPTPRQFKENKQGKLEGDKTYFGAISVGRTKGGECIDAHKIVLCGVDPESAAVAAQSAFAAKLVADLDMPTSREVAAFLDDPSAFLASWAVEDQRLHMFNMVVGLLEVGQNIEPINGERIGDYYVVRNGRHRVAVQRVVVAVLAGECPCPPTLKSYFAAARERGMDWKPHLTALPPVDDARTGVPMDANTFAELSQAVRIFTPAEVYSRAMVRVNAARTDPTVKKPDFDTIARNYPGVTGAMVEAWERLSKMEPQVRKLVLEGDDTGKRFPLWSALAFTQLPHEEQIAKVRAMLGVGDTRVTTAKATAKAARTAPTEDVAADDGHETETPADLGGAPGRDAPVEPRTGDGGVAAPKAPKRPAPAVVRPGWGIRELRRFLDDAAKAERPAPVIKALRALLAEGPDRMDAVSHHAIPGLPAYLSAQDAETKGS